MVDKLAESTVDLGGSSGGAEFSKGFDGSLPVVDKLAGSTVDLGGSSGGAEFGKEFESTLLLGAWGEGLSILMKILKIDPEVGVRKGSDVSLRRFEPYYIAPLCHSPP